MMFEKYDKFQLSTKPNNHWGDQKLTRLVHRYVQLSYPILIYRHFYITLDFHYHSNKMQEWVRLNCGYYDTNE